MKKILDALLGIAIIVLFLFIIVFSKLFQNKAGESWSIDNLFSVENVEDTLTKLVVFAVLVVPIILVWNLLKKK